MKEKLSWKIKSKETVLKTPVFDVIYQDEESETGIKGKYVGISAPDWVLVVPVINDKFILVKQFRHGYEGLTYEFPGGVANKDEDPKITAYRELKEETGYDAKTLVNLGYFSPNPALFKNKIHIYLATNLIPTNVQKLDADELVSYKEFPINEVIENFGKNEFVHAYMGTALFLYQRYINKK